MAFMISAGMRVVMVVLGASGGPWKRKEGCCTAEGSLCFEVRKQAGGPGSAAAQAF